MQPFQFFCNIFVNFKTQAQLKTTIIFTILKQFGVMFIYRKKEKH